MEEDAEENRWRRGVTKTSPTFRAGQYVRISKKTTRIAKAAEQNLSTEIFEVAKIIKMSPRVVYEHKDLNGAPIDCQFYRD
jgi:hypothetical protein